MHLIAGTLHTARYSFYSKLSDFEYQTIKRSCVYHGTNSIKITGEMISFVSQSVSKATQDGNIAETLNSTFSLAAYSGCHREVWFGPPETTTSRNQFRFQNRFLRFS